MNEEIERRGNNKILKAGSKWMSGKLLSRSKKLNPKSKVEKPDKQPDLQRRVPQSLEIGGTRTSDKKEWR